jgi:hypothetical protein
MPTACGTWDTERWRDIARKTPRDEVFEMGETHLQFDQFAAKLVVVAAHNIFLSWFNYVPLAFVLFVAPYAWAAWLDSVAFDLSAFALCAAQSLSAAFLLRWLVARARPCATVSVPI